MAAATGSAGSFRVGPCQAKKSWIEQAMASGALGAATHRAQSGRVWTNCYHHDPAHAAFGGYKLDHDQQTKNPLVSDSENKRGFF
ncbi:MAG: hypothetical protein QM586_10095 [Xenophilus sp.]